MDSQPPPPSSSSMMEPISFVSHPLMSPSSTMLAPATARFPYQQVPPPSLPSVIPSEPFTTAAVVTTTIPYDGSLNSSALNPSGPAKKKRGRPRKYSLDSNVALGLAPTSSTGHGGDNGGGSGGGDLSGTMSTEGPVKRPRGRPPGSGKKQLDAHGAGAVGFKHHVIFVNSGER
ncbi:putative AT hook, DNA-binding protein [Lupinus albus]|uniref:AT-hook motif nuclear-localized protein n=1 Tax=Lupinus albus TaxID=3870 RepID=A0A6A4QJ81_LUPAL|nr:putative AT hook, DNA-binding protein [Lupinus albus]